MKIIAIVLLILFSSVTQASENCWKDAGDRYGVDPWLLYAIAKKESNLQSNAINRNKDGSEDVSIMQINSKHFTKLASFGITREMLITDPCIAINIAAWLIAENFAHYGKNWRSVGMYNAGTANNETQENRRRRYADSVEQIYIASLRGE